MPRLTETIIEKLIEFQQFMNISYRNSIRLGVLKNIDTKHMIEISKRYDKVLNELLNSVKEYNNDPSALQKEFLSKNLEHCLRNQKVIAKLIREHLELAAKDNTVRPKQLLPSSVRASPSVYATSDVYAGDLPTHTNEVSSPKKVKTSVIPQDATHATPSDKKLERKYSAEPSSEEEHKVWLVDTLRKCIESEMSITSYCRSLTSRTEVQNAITMAKKIPDISHQYDMSLKELFRNIKSYSEDPSVHSKETLANSMNLCEARRKPIKEFIMTYLATFPCPDGTKFDARLRAEFETDSTVPQTLHVSPHDFEYMKTLIDYMKIMLIANIAKKA
jgi:hypothetical protein